MKKIKRSGLLLAILVIICSNSYESDAQCNKHLADIDLHIKANKRRSKPSTSFKHKMKEPVGNIYRVLKADIEFDNNADYDLSAFGNDTADWNKVLFISTLPAYWGGRWSVRLGWRWSLHRNKMELGLYTHINHKNNGAGRHREFLSLDEFVDKNVSFPAELIFEEFGLYARAGDHAYAIRRDMDFNTNKKKTGVRKNAYFGGTQKAPHRIDIDLRNMDVDCTPIWFDAPHKGFSRSRWYSGENLSYFASKTITASILAYKTGEVPMNGTGERYTVVENGSTLDFTACEEITLKDGFHAEAGSDFHAEIIACRLPGPVQPPDPITEDKEAARKPAAADEDPVANSEAVSEREWVDEEFHENLAIPAETSFNCYPNPFTDHFNISFSLHQQDQVSLTIYNLSGIVVDRLVEQVSYEAGNYRFEYATAHLPKGVYICLLRTSDQSLYRKMMKQD